MRVVYVVEALELSGGVKVIVEHAEGLAARGHAVSIVTRDARHPWIPIGVPVVEVSAFDASTLPEADVHIATWFPTVVPTVRAGRARRVLHFSQGWEALYPNVSDRLAEIEEAYSQPIPKLLISAHLAPLFAGRYPGSLHVLPYAMRVDAFRPPAERTAPRTPATIGIVGPFETSGRGKGIPVGLRAFLRLRAGGRAVRLHRASQLPQSDAECSLCAADDYAVALPVTEMPAWYRRLDVLIHPSFHAEGLPLPPGEAMASGVPVVLTTIPSYGEIPREAAGWAEPGDDTGLAREAARLLDDEALWRERRARGLALSSGWTVERAVDALERILASA